MTTSIYPRQTVMTAMVVAVVLLLFGLGAIASLIVAPSTIQTNMTADQSLWSALIGAIDRSRLLYSLKNAGLQASLSVIFSIIIAIPAAIAVARRPDWLGIKGLVMVISLAMVLPSTVAAMGLLAVWGRNGMVASLCGGGCGDMSIYGLHGVVIAHMMLNVPLVMRVMIPLLNAVHQSKWRNAALLGLSPWERFRHIEWPAIRGVIPGLASLIFMLCFTSFALVLMLGGGPKVTTLEVEIYSAVRFEFNLLAAAGLSLIQFAFMALVVASFAFWGGWHASGDLRSLTNPLPRHDLGATDRLWDMLVMGGIILLVALPVVMVGIRGLNMDLLTLLKRPQFYDAAKASFSVAMTTSFLVTGLSLIMAYGKASLSLSHRHRALPFAGLMRVVLDQGVLLYLVIPSVVLGTAAFIVLRGWGDVFGYAFAVVVMANTLLTLPFAYRLLERRLTGILAQHDRLSLQLGVMGWYRLKILTLPALRYDLGLVAGLTAALSIGDLGVIALFASADFRTLPWLLYQLSGKYAADEAAALAFVLMLVTITFFWLGRVVISRLCGGRYA